MFEADEGVGDRYEAALRLYSVDVGIVFAEFWSFEQDDVRAYYSL